MKMKTVTTCFLLFTTFLIYGQTWENVDSLFQPLPASVHVFRSVDSVEEMPNTMYYVEADLKDKRLLFTSDTTSGRRLTPDEYYKKNDDPLLIVNTSFFTFETNRNLNVIVKDGKLVSYNVHNVKKKNDSTTWLHPFYGALGIFKNRTADVAWIYSDTTKRYPFASQTVVPAFTDSLSYVSDSYVKSFRPWKVKTAVSGGPVLVQNHRVEISNDEELRFPGKAIDDKHPRTAMGYTKDNRLIIFVCEGRSATAAGLSLRQMAEILKNIGCQEALNLDGGGSTCLLLNGKEVNTPSSNGVQRALPSVFIIKEKDR